MAGRNGARAAARTNRNGGSPLPGFEAKVQNGTARIGIIGLGYVGLPLAVEFAKKGFRVTGFEINKKRVGILNSGRSYIQDVPTTEVRELVKSGHLRAKHLHCPLSLLRATE